MTVPDEKDRYGDKLQQVENARENQWAAERDRVLLAKMRDRADEQTVVKQRQSNSPRVFNRILCPVDFNEDSLAALDLAHYLAVQNDAELDVLHVRTKFSVPSGSELATELESEQSAREKLKEIAHKHLGTVRYSLLTMTGGAAERVIDAGSTLAADLIVMGRRRRRTVPHLLLGSVAEQVVREAGCPVLTTQVTEVPTSKADFFKRILCPVDFDASSLEALDLTRRMAAQTGALVYLLHTCPTVAIPLGNLCTSVSVGGINN
jgi:nucleotide-binding universal stress UspA family protein